MPSAIAPGHECLILDACCIINIAATSRMEEIIRSFGMPIAVAAYVREKELLSLARADPADLEEDPIDLQPLILRGLIEIVAATDSEEAMSLRLTADPHRLDEGEAISGAIALHRNWAVGTDDRRGTAVLLRLSPNIPVLSTPELLSHWATQVRPDADQLRAVLNQVQVRACYQPARQHPFGQWWRNHS